jgi:hypothetical protein
VVPALTRNNAERFAFTPATRRVTPGRLGRAGDQAIELPAPGGLMVERA